MKKFISIFLAILMIAALSTPAYATIPNSGTVKVNSRYSDGSIRQVTLSNGSFYNNGFTYNNVSFSITYPQGRTNNTPTAAQCWDVLLNGLNNGNSYYDNGNGRNNNVTYIYDGNGYGDYIYNGRDYVYVGQGNGDYKYYGGNTYQYVGYYTVQNQPQPIPVASRSSLTAAQQEAENQLRFVRQTAEQYGWALEWWPSTTTTATANRCWYGCEANQLINGQITTYRFSVLTEKANGWWATAFKTYQNGHEHSSQTPSEVKDMLVRYSVTRALPPNIVQATNASSAVNATINYLKSRGYNVSNYYNNNYYNSAATNVPLTLSWYGSYQSWTLYLTVEQRDNSTWRWQLSDANGGGYYSTHAYLYTVREILTFSL